MSQEIPTAVHDVSVDGKTFKCSLRVVSCDKCHAPVDVLLPQNLLIIGILCNPCMDVFIAENACHCAGQQKDS